LSLALVYSFIHSNFIAQVPFYEIDLDPELIYLFDSLAALTGRPYVYVDHPGTPVEVLGTLVLAALRIGFKGDDAQFANQYIAQPQQFLFLARGLLASASIVTFLAMAESLKHVKGVIGALVSAAIPCAFFASYPEESFNTLVYWSHNSFAFPAGTLVLVILFRMLRAEGDIPPWKAGLLGMASGVLTAVTVLFGAWIAGITAAVMAYSWFQKRRLAAALVPGAYGLAGAAMGFVLATLPIIDQYPRFFRFVANIATHTGRYGRGETGFVHSSMALDNLRSLLEISPRLWLALAAGVILLCLAMALEGGRLRVRPGWTAMGIAMLVQLTVLILFVTLEPGRHYLLAVAATLPLLYTLALPVLLQRSASWRKVVVVVSALLVSAFGVGVWQAARGEVLLAATIRLQIQQVDYQRKEFARRSADPSRQPSVMWVYGTQHPCYAIRFGSLHTEGAFSEQVDHLCPNDGRLSLGARRTFDPSSRRWDDAKWDILVLPLAALSRDAPLSEAGTRFEIIREDGLYIILNNRGLIGDHEG